MFVFNSVKEINRLRKEINRLLSKELNRLRKKIDYRHAKYLLKGYY